MSDISLDTRLDALNQPEISAFNDEENTSSDAKKKSGNFIIDTFRVCNEMEKSTEGFVKGAKENEKALKQMWKGSNSVKKDKELVMAGMHMRAAYVQMGLLAANVLCTIAGYSLGARAAAGGLSPNLARYTEQSGKLLTDFGGTITKSGSELAQSVQQSYMGLLQSDIGEYVEKGQKLWDDATNDQKQRVDEVNALKNKMDQTTQETLQKTGASYSVSR